MAQPKPGRGVVWGVAAGTLSLVAGVLVASQTVDAIDPLYRFGRATRPARPAPVPSGTAEPAFAPIRWSGFAATPPPGRDGHDDPALLGGVRPRPVAEPELKLPPPEPVRARRQVAPDTPVTEPLDLPPAITPAEIGEAG